MAPTLGLGTGQVNQKQHSTWDRYTHISLTLSQVTHSRTERNKNRELVKSTASESRQSQPGARWAWKDWKDTRESRVAHVCPGVSC